MKILHSICSIKYKVSEGKKWIESITWIIKESAGVKRNSSFSLRSATRESINYLTKFHLSLFSFAESPFICFNSSFPSAFGILALRSRKIFRGGRSFRPYTVGITNTYVISSSLMRKLASTRDTQTLSFIRARVKRVSEKKTRKKRAREMQRERRIKKDKKRRKTGRRR